jgi:hypothetical protein
MVVQLPSVARDLLMANRLLRRTVRRWIVGLLVAATVAPVAAQAPSLAMLTRLDRGLWELRFRPDNRLERLCIRDGLDFIQLRHPNDTCGRFVVEDTADRVTVQYTCRGRGYGRTFIRRENNSLAQIQSQGLISGQPFDIAAEARWVGRCN